MIITRTSANHVQVTGVMNSAGQPETYEVFTSDDARIVNVSVQRTNGKFSHLNPVTHSSIRSRILAAVKGV